jgi:fructose/tagatose bisphosphate aldolase
MRPFAPCFGRSAASAIRVDAVAYANWAGAYTTLYPTRPTISTLNSANQETAALEIVFHGSSHAMMDLLSILL